MTKRLLTLLWLLPLVAYAHTPQHVTHPWEKADPSYTQQALEWWCYPHCVQGGDPGGPWQWQRRVGVAPAPTIGRERGAEK